jgi:hypothetical protein
MNLVSPPNQKIRRRVNSNQTRSKRVFQTVQNRARALIRAVTSQKVKKKRVKKLKVF